MQTLTSDRASQIGSVLERVVALARALGAPRSTPFGDAVLTRTQLDILFVLSHHNGPVTPGRLAATMKVTAGAITQTMDQLRDKGLVAQSSSEADGRVRMWELTESAAGQVAEFEAATVARTAPWFASLSAEELDQLGTLLRRIGAD